jgi:hypothetical protein
VPSEVTNSFGRPLACDEDGNVYLRTEYGGSGAVNKISLKGQKVAVFQASPNPSFEKIDIAGYFSVWDDNLYQLVFPHVLDRYVFSFKPDGSFKAAVKLSTGFPWIPGIIAVYPSGQFLVSGLEYDKDATAAKWPITGIFDADGSLLKEVRLEEDDTLHDMAAAGDTRVTTPGMSGVNHAISNGAVEVAGDGNAYLMRWTDPAIFYAISAGGEVVRKFKLDAGEPGFMPSGMHVHKNRIAVLFLDPQRGDHLIMKVVDLDGNVLATYEQRREDRSNARQQLSAAFACYLENPTRFVFAGADDDNRLQLWLAEGRK